MVDVLVRQAGRQHRLGHLHEEVPPGHPGELPLQCSDVVLLGDQVLQQALVVPERDAHVGAVARAVPLCGKGFAVVANEVKNLAGQVGRATEEISQQIAQVQSETGTAVQAIQTIVRTIEEVNEVASAIAAAVEQQNAATHEISRNVQEAAAGSQEVSRNIVGVTEAANETGSAAGQVLSATQQMSDQANRLNGLVNRFLSDVRAA